MLKLKNPPVNSLSLELLTDLAISVEKLENDKSFRGIVITSVGVPSRFSHGEWACSLDLLSGEAAGKLSASLAWGTPDSVLSAIWSPRLSAVAPK